MLNRIHRYPVKREETADEVNHLALRGRQLALLTKDELRLVTLSSENALRMVASYRLGWAPAGVSLSASLGYALLSDAEQSRLVVYDLKSGSTVAEFNRHAPKPYPVPGALGVVGGKEVLLVSPRVHQLEGYYLKDMTPAFVASCNVPSPFIFTHLYSINHDDDTFFALGFHIADMMDTLVTLSVQELISDNEAAGRELRLRSRISDYAQRIAVGPGEADQAVFFRDPDQYETPLDDDDEETQWGELWNFRGLYLRRISDGQLVKRWEYDAPIKTGAPIFATEQVVVVACPDRVELVPRPGIAGEVSVLPCRSSSLDPDHRRIALLDDNGEIEIIEVL